MSNLVIVAIPDENDPVWKISSEKVPHLTLLFLGDVTSGVPVLEIAKYIEHAAEMSLERFWLTVDRRGTLGPDEADVLFFDPAGWDIPEIKKFRSYLLKDNNIKTAYDSTTQYPEWTPHLTLGYPATPAKELEGHERFYDVRFDRIALWFGDYEGPVFPLKSNNYALDEVAMSSTQEVGQAAVVDFLQHYGVKGMRWGVRKGIATAAPFNKRARNAELLIRGVEKHQTKKAAKKVADRDVTVTEKGKKIKSKGGKGLEAHDDALKAEVARRKAKGSGVKVLSNQELQELSTRMNLEQQVSRLESTRSTNVGKKFVAKILGDAGKTQVTKIVNDQANKQVQTMLAKK